MQIESRKIGAIAFIVLLIMVTFCQPDPAGAAPIVNTDKDVYTEGETIKVSFSNAPGNSGDWICIAQAGAPDTDPGDYKYVPKGSRQGVLTFDPPSAGKYEVRAYYDYSRAGYAVAGRYAFSVGSRGSIPPVESRRMPPAVPPAAPRAAAGKTVPVEKSAATAIPQGASRNSVSVFHFNPLTMDASSYGIIVTNTLVNAPRMQSAFAMMDRKDLQNFLVANDLQQNDQLENVINIGTKTGINFVIAGNVGKKGTMIVTNCKVVSIEQRKVIFTNQSISMGETDLISNITKMSDAIIEAILRSGS